MTYVNMCLSLNFKLGGLVLGEVIVTVSSIVPQSGIAVWEVVLQKFSLITLMKPMVPLHSPHSITMGSTVPTFLVRSLV